MTAGRNQSGDTLVEVVLSLAIMGTVLVTAFNIATLSYKVGEQSREHTQAIDLAQEQAEILVDYRNQQLVSAGGTGFITGPCASSNPTYPDIPTQFLHTSPSNSCWLTTTSGSIVSNPGVETNGLYSVWIQRLSKPAGDTLGANTALYGVFVEWSSAIGTQQNSTELTVVLADETNFKVKPCEDLTQC